MTNGNVKAVCSWIGNSPAVAMQHYAQVTEAAKMTVLNDAEKTVQKSVLTTAESSRTTSHECDTDSDVSLWLSNSLHHNAGRCENIQKEEKWAIQDLNL